MGEMGCTRPVRARPVRHSACSCCICLAGDPKRYTLPQRTPDTPRIWGCGAYRYVGWVTCLRGTTHESGVRRLPHAGEPEDNCWAASVLSHACYASNDLTTSEFDRPSGVASLTFSVMSTHVSALPKSPRKQTSAFKYFVVDTLTSLGVMGLGSSEVQVTNQLSTMVADTSCIR